jgi:hypothetical protein
MKIVLAAMLLAATPALCASQLDEIIKERGRCVSAAATRYSDTIHKTGDADAANKQEAKDDAACAAAQDRAIDKLKAEQGGR